MRLKVLTLALVIGSTSTLVQGQKENSRESRQLLQWLFGGTPSKPDQELNKIKIGENVQRPTQINSQVFQRRSNQLAEEIKTRGLARGRVLNRPPPSKPAGPVKSYRPPPAPGQVPRPKKRIPAPLIISSYASSVVQGKGKQEQKRIQDTFEKYEKLNEISDEDVEEKLEEIKEIEEVVEEVIEEEVDTEATIEQLDDYVEQEQLAQAQEVEEKVVENVTLNIEETSSTSTTTTTTLKTPTTEKLVSETESTLDNEIEFEIVDSENPYLPEIPEKLDEHIHGADLSILPDEKEASNVVDVLEAPKEKSENVAKEKYQAGYKEIDPVKINTGDRHDHHVRPKPVPQNKNFFPLGKPQRPPFKAAQPAKQDGSIFDFLPNPFWKKPDAAKVNPRRPIGPPQAPSVPVGPPRAPLVSHKVTQLDHTPDYPKGLHAPLLLKVDDAQDGAPVRPDVVEETVISSRIDNSLQTELTDKNNDAFVVLPKKVHESQQPKRPLNIKRPRVPPPPSKRFPRPPQRPLNPRLPNEGPLPMLSQPVIGLPQVPAGRKQSPFIPKRPLLPPQLPQNYPGGPKKPLGPKTPLIKPTISPKDKTPFAPFNKPTIPPKDKLAFASFNKPTLPPAKLTVALNKTKILQKLASDGDQVTKKPLDNILKKPQSVSLSPKVIAKLTSQTKVNQASKKPFDFRPNGSSQQPSQISSHLSSIMNFFWKTTPSPIPSPSLPSLVEDTEFADIVHGYKPSDKNETETRGEITTTTEVSLKSTTVKPSINAVKNQYDELDSLTAPLAINPINNFKKINRFPQNKIRPQRPVTTQRPIPTTTTTTASLRPSTTTSTTTLRTSPTSTSVPPTTTKTALKQFAQSKEDTTFSPQIQAIVQEYQNKGQVLSQPSYSKPVLQAIKKNFEHKKNIFEQFVTFDENDKAFIPNKEVVNSDWSFDSSPISDLSDKILVYQTITSDTSSEALNSRISDTTISPNRRISASTFPNERNAQGGFRPMLGPQLRQ